MYLTERQPKLATAPNRRAFPRIQIQCRARILIGRRHYAGYLHNISRNGAKLRTISPIRKPGVVLLHLPDLPPLKCKLCWNDAYNAGVAFELKLTAAALADWARSRSARQSDVADLEVVS